MGIRLSLRLGSFLSPGSAVVTFSVGLSGGDLSAYETSDEGGGEEGEKAGKEREVETYGGGEEEEVELLTGSTSVGGKRERQRERVHNIC